MGDHLFQCGFQIGFSTDRRTATSVTLRDLNEVRVSLFGECTFTLALGFGVMNRPEVSMSTIAIHEPIFPLDHHSKMLVVEKHDLDRQVLAVTGRQFLDVHLKAAVAINIDDERIAGEELTFFPVADAAANTFRVRVELPDGSATLYPGMFVKVGFVVTIEGQRSPVTIYLDSIRFVD